MAIHWRLVSDAGGLGQPVKPRVQSAIHALSVDVEDWNNVAVLHATGRIVPPTEAVVRNTEGLLELFAELGLRCTWFLLGEVATAFPGLVRRLADAGHELGVHGYHHHFVHTLTEAKFRDAIRRAKDAVEQVAQTPVLGHRAPAFSITADVPWAFEVLAELGFRYDSSIFPFRGRRYGTADAPLTPYEIPTHSGELTEVPLSVVDFGRHRVPCCGGGYLRHFPLAYTRCAMWLLSRRARRAVLYLHPYEIDLTFDTGFLRQHLLPNQSRRFGVSHWLQYRNRDRTLAKLRWLLTKYRFSSIAEAFSSELECSGRSVLPTTPEG